MPQKVLLRKTSLVDYPGRISSVLFFPSCNLRCPWCHNRELVLSGVPEGAVPLEEALAHLKKRKSVLGGVVISGGEPCLWEGLPSLIEEIKKLPLAVKIDTNGMFPGVLEKLICREETRPDYIAMDLKLAPDRYKELLPKGQPIDNYSLYTEHLSLPFNPGEALIQSAVLVRTCGIAHEFRTLMLPGGHFTEKDRQALAPLAEGSVWRFRPFRGGNCLDPAWDKMAQTSE